MRTLVWVWFVAAMGWGVSRALARHTAIPCDTPPGTCTINDDCDAACLAVGGTHGGSCLQGQGCCVCFQ